MLRRGDGGRRLGCVEICHVVVGRGRVVAANIFVYAWHGSSNIAAEQVLSMLCVSSCCRRCQHESKDDLDCIGLRKGVTVPIVSVRRFSSLSDYQRYNGRGGVQVDVDCSVADLVRYSLHNGSYGGHIIWSRTGRSFYRSIPRFALAYDRTLDTYVMRDDYRFAESSYKATVSFFLGMIGVRVVYEKLMGGSKPGSFLFHAGNNKQFLLKSRSGMQKPDFIAVDENGDPYALFEGKGSSDSGVKSYQIERGKEQVEGVSSITLKGARGVSGKVKRGVDLKKHVVASGFSNRPGVRGGVWSLFDVDPNGEGVGDLLVDFDGAVFDYYAPIVSILSTGSGDVVKVNGVNCELVKAEDGVVIGLVQGLRDVICEIVDKKANPETKYQYICERMSDGCARRVAKYLNGLDGIVSENRDKHVSMGADGIVVMVSDEYVQSFNMGSD